jgi:hypothetical protein
VPLGTYWVTQQAKNNFETAISTAKGALNSKSQSVVNSAATTLTNQIEQFKNTRQAGTAEPVNKTALEAKIAEAEQAKLGVATSVDGSDVAQGIKWVTSAAMLNFEIAITTAKAAVSAATTQTAVDNLLAALNSAINTFTNAQQNGSKTTGFTQAELTALIVSANAAKTGVKTSANGDDTGPAEYWVSQNVLTTFNNAITTAQNAAGDFDSAYFALVTAINTFNAAKALGSTPDKTALFNAIRSADMVKDGVVVAASAAQAAYGSRWATQAQWTPFDMAYNNALNLAADSNATKNQVSALTTALTSATNTFSSAVSGNGLGTKQNSVTINGLSSFNGEEINVGLFASADISMESQSGIYGSGTIQNGTVKVDLYNTSGYNSPWVGNGSWYVGFQINDADTPQIYISKSAVNFTVTPNAVTSLSDYKKYVFRYVFGEIAEEMGVEIPANGITLDAWCQQMNGMTYAQMLEAGAIPGQIYKNEALTQPFNGSDMLYANTVIYCEFDMMGGDGGENRTKIGDITGTITLTDVPSPAPQVWISVSGNNEYDWWGTSGSRLNISGTGTVTNISWSIPVYENDNFFASTGNFYLYISSGNNGFNISIPTTPYISNANANVGSLGTVSIKSITLSGTINVTYNGQPVPYVQISAYPENGGYGSSTELTSPGSNASWSITMPAFNSSTQIYFSVNGYQDRYGNNQLFYRGVTLNPPIYASNTNVTGINLNVGNIADPNTPVNPVPLVAGTWVNGEIINSGDVDWYSISVANGSTYYLWWNDSYDGDNTKTLDIDVYAYNSSGNLISLANNDSAWYDPVSFTASSSGTVYVRVRAYGGSGSTGTYAIVYNTSNNKPVIPYTVTFSNSGGGGTVPSPIIAYSGSSINLPNGDGLTYYDDGYIFTGWYDSYTGYTYNAGSSYIVTGNVTLNAQWGYAYTVTFNLNGAEYGTLPGPQKALYGSTIILPYGSDLSKTDYTFGGWNTNLSGTGTNYSAGSQYTVTSTVTLYAKWNSTAPGSQGNPILLTAANTWVDGNLPTGGEQWFKFTATSSTQYIHVNFGTLSDLYVQLYNSDGGTVGSQANLYGSTKYASRSLNYGQEYYIKVTPFSSYGSGAYQIAFNMSSAAPGTGITLPSNAIPLTASVWADGSLSTGGEQWFKFTATSSTQYIHVSFGTLQYLYVQLYNSEGGTVVSQTILYSSAKYVSMSLNSGQEYYIKVTPYSSYSGTYQIAFNMSSAAPGTGITLPSNAIPLTASVWADGNLSTGGEQWFKFTATSNTQYIHVSFGTLSDLYVQLYNSDGGTVGDRTNLYSNTKYVSRSLNYGQEYYIKVTPYGSGSGAYQIAFNTSSTAPSTGTAGTEADPIQLTSGAWVNGSITSTASGSAVWYSFNVTSGTTYYVWWNDSDNTAGMMDILMDAKYSSGTAIFTGADTENYKSFTANTSGAVYVKVYPYSSGTGTFAIVYSTSSIKPTP